MTDTAEKSARYSTISGSAGTVAKVYVTEFTTDDPSKIGTGAIKYDGGKPCSFRGAIEYFPRAITAVAEISTFGAKKYAWKGWEQVDDGIARYSDAMVRHLLKEGTGETVDPDSGLLHAAHCAWGALARLELILRDIEKSCEAHDIGG
jgi:hypothetical protein